MHNATSREEAERLVDLARLVQGTGYAFVTPTPLTHARVNARPGNAWARDLRCVFGWSRPFHDAVVPPDVMGAMRAAGVLAPHEGGWRSLVRLSSLDGLLLFHSAFPTVEADAVFFGPDTYRFARAVGALPRGPVGRAADVGCGAGPAAILIARAHPGAEVYGLDINERALGLTRANAMLAGVAVEALHSDLLSGVPGLFDLVVANPPYLVDPSERAYRHGGGALGAGLSLKILDAAIGRLAPGGTLLLYTGAAIVDGRDPFLAAAAARLAGAGLVWRYQEMDPDVFGEELDHGVYAQADRIAAVTLVATRPAAPR